MTDTTKTIPEPYQYGRLKPCPFCGEPLARYEEKGDWVIECNANSCLMITGRIDKKDVLERMLEAGR